MVKLMNTANTLHFDTLKKRNEELEDKLSETKKKHDHIDHFMNENK